MKTRILLVLVASAGILGGCAANAPKELVNARTAYQRAADGPASKVALSELHIANQALAKAERSFEESSDSYMTKDLAYVAHRKALMAEATASIAIQQKSQVQSSSDYQMTQGKIVTQTKQELSQTRSDLAASEHQGDIAAERLTAEQSARLSAEKRAAAAQLALANLAAVKEEPRGMVITLSGSVLFASNQSTLLPAAQAKLNQVADVLLTTSERNITIEGHTDSQGSEKSNLDLSQRRAEAVRTYLVQRKYEGDRITANGLGEGRPIADNTSPEGRANNRRVEIIIDREAMASN